MPDRSTLLPAPSSSPPHLPRPFIVRRRGRRGAAYQISLFCPQRRSILELRADCDQPLTFAPLHACVALAHAQSVEHIYELVGVRDLLRLFKRGGYRWRPRKGTANKIRELARSQAFMQTRPHARRNSIHLPPGGIKLRPSINVVEDEPTVTEVESIAADSGGEAKAAQSARAPPPRTSGGKDRALQSSSGEIEALSGQVAALTKSHEALKEQLADIAGAQQRMEALLTKHFNAVATQL